ncbi:MAG: hypothetical protein HPY80_12900 [Bacteroidales bacterium]|nr:hypothetical protein [Bacteroidales bacterium]NPV37551.1 hypothetical protein [Bacteroidales bacterium]
MILSLFLISCGNKTLAPVEQKSISRIEQMPDIPSPLSIIDWRSKALQFDSLVFNLQATVPMGPFIWIDTNKRNFPQNTFGLYTAIGDIRQGPQHNGGEFHEALCSLSSLVSAGLVGIDKTNQKGYNYVKMAQNYFNRENGWNIVMNNTHPEVASLGGGYGRDWWYDIYPNILFYATAQLFPGVKGNSEILLSIANQFYKADSILAGNYDYSFFDYGQMKPGRNHIPWQQDAAGGHAWVLYSAYQLFKDQRFLNGARQALDALNKQPTSRFYEVLLPFGAYIAARFNAEQNTSFDVGKMLNFIFDGCQDTSGRFGWGVIAERWGDYDVYGLQGSITDGGGYAFLMNSIVLAWPLVPLVKYEPAYAKAIAKYMLNAVNASRLFYPDQIDEKHQWLPEKKDLTNGIIGYEGLRKYDDYGKPSLKGVSPVALGDGPKWAKGQPEESMFSIYSSSVAGVYGAIVNKTNVEGILKLDCNATDFYAENPFPVFMLYNPYPSSHKVSYSAQSNAKLYDMLMHQFITQQAIKDTMIEMKAGEVLLIAELPPDAKISVKDSRIMCDGKVVAWK